MLRSMFTAIGALNLHQSYLDVVANNLANANTAGYKASRVIFQDQFAQLLNPGSSPTTILGGTNPNQIGLGVQMGSISPVFSQGMMQSTGRNLDLAIQGDGFLIYSDSGQIRYGREGAITRDAGGFLVNSSTGHRLQGWTSTNGAPIDTSSPVSSIEIPANKTVAKATTKATFGGNLISSYPLDDGNAATTTDNPIMVTMGVYDSLGNPNTADVAFTHASIDATAHTSTWNWNCGTNSGTVTFNSSGGYVSSTGTGAVTIPAGTGTNAMPITMALDMTGITQLSTATTAAVTTQDGLAAGNVVDLLVAPNDGSVWLVYSNGMREQFAQVALARFSNPSGLIRSGNTTFQQGFNSGEAQIGSAGTGGRGTISAGYLEGSNVDMAQEFTNMILAQRGFQASSRVITTSDEIIQELVNLKR